MPESLFCCVQSTLSAGIKNLTWLNLGSNETLDDIDPLAGLTNLTELDLHRTGISDITSLEGLTKLILLDLQQNDISNLNFLAGLKKLIELDMSDNNISNISPLSGLTSLEKLDLRDNNLNTGDCSVLNRLTSKGAKVSISFDCN